MSIASHTLSLAFGLTFEDLYSRDGLVHLDRAFLDYAARRRFTIYERLLAARANPASLPRKSASELIIAIAPYLEDFTGQLFGIQTDLRDLQARHHGSRPLRRQTKIRPAQSRDQHPARRSQTLDGVAIAADLETLFEEPLTELTFARCRSLA